MPSTTSCLPPFFALPPLTWGRFSLTSSTFSASTSARRDASVPARRGPHALALDPGPLDAGGKLPEGVAVAGPAALPSGGPQTGGGWLGGVEERPGPRGTAESQEALLIILSSCTVARVGNHNYLLYWRGKKIS